VGTNDVGCSPAEQAKIEELRSKLNVSRAVLHARISQGLSQDALGRMAGTKQSRFSEIESMGGNPRLDTLDRIARALGLMVDLVPRVQLTQVGSALGMQMRPVASMEAVVVSHSKWNESAVYLKLSPFNG